MVRSVSLVQLEGQQAPKSVSETTWQPRHQHDNSTDSQKKQEVRGNHHTTQMTASRTSTSSGLRLRSHSQQGSTIQWSPAAMIVDVGDPSAPTNQANEIITLHLQDHVLRFFRQLRRGPEVPQSELCVCQHICPQNASTSS